MGRVVVAYDPSVRQKAVRCFKDGLGYKKTAEKLQIPESTVRDWKRLWVKGEFSIKWKIASFGPDVLLGWAGTILMPWATEFTVPAV